MLWVRICVPLQVVDKGTGECDLGIGVGVWVLYLISWVPLQGINHMLIMYRSGILTMGNYINSHSSIALKVE